MNGFGFGPTGVNTPAAAGVDPRLAALRRRRQMQMGRPSPTGNVMGGGLRTGAPGGYAGRMPGGYPAAGAGMSPLALALQARMMGR